MSLRVNAVFEGGGVRGIAHVGALLELEKNPEIQIVGVGGSSAGAIIAALYAANYTSDELHHEMKKTPLSTLLRRPRFLMVSEILADFGIYDSQGIYDWIAELLNKKGFSNFTDLKRTCKIVVANVTDQKAKVFSNQDDFEIAEAVRMSISIPFFFKPRLHGEKHYVDGGLVSNYPLWLFAESELPTVGLRLSSRTGFRKHRRIGNLLRYTVALFKTASEASDRAGRGYPEHAYSIPIECEGIASTDFDLNKQDIKLLFNSGRLAVTSFDWTQVKPAPKINFRDPKAHEVLDATVREVDKIFTQGFQDKPQRFYKSSSTTYFIDADGTARCQREYVVMISGDHPLYATTHEIMLGEPDQYLSFADLAVKAEDMSGGHTEVSIVPSRNTGGQKHFALFYLPRIMPGESRRVRLNYRVPKGFSRFIDYQNDEVVEEQNSELGIASAALYIQLDPKLGNLEILDRRGESKYASLPDPDKPPGLDPKTEYKIWGWKFQFPTVPKKLQFIVEFRRTGAK